MFRGDCFEGTVSRGGRFEKALLLLFVMMPLKPAMFEGAFPSSGSPEVRGRNEERLKNDIPKSTDFLMQGEDVQVHRISRPCSHSPLLLLWGKSRCASQGSGKAYAYANSYAVSSVREGAEA